MGRLQETGIPHRTFKCPRQLATPLNKDRGFWLSDFGALRWLLVDGPS